MLWLIKVDIMDSRTILVLLEVVCNNNYNSKYKALL